METIRMFDVNKTHCFFNNYDGLKSLRHKIPKKISPIQSLNSRENHFQLKNNIKLLNKGLIMSHIAISYISSKLWDFKGEGHGSIPISIMGLTCLENFCCFPYQDQHYWRIVIPPSWLQVTWKSMLFVMSFQFIWVQIRLNMFFHLLCN